MKNYTKMKKLLILLLLIYSNLVFSQNTGNLSGKITDKATNKALENVEIMILELSRGTTTDAGGEYTFKELPYGTYTIKIKLLGYKSLMKKIKFNDKSKKYFNYKLEKDNVSLGEVVISAAKLNKTVKKIGSPVYVITPKELERTEGRNIEEALIKIPGVFTEDRFHNETNIVSFRGVGLHTHVTSGILVLVDGVSLTEAMGRTDFEGVDLENAKKIEILKGPVSALYGPNGVTGVMNIVEKTPKPGFHGKIKASYGTYNTQTYSGNINGGKDGFRYMIKGKYYTTDGYLVRNESSSGRIGVKLSQQVNETGKLQFTSDYVSSSMDLPGTLNREDFDNRETTPSNPNKFAGYDRDFSRTNLIYTQKFDEKINLFTNIFYNTKNSEGFYSDRALAKDDLKSLGGEIRSQFKTLLFNKENTLITGISYTGENNDDKVYNRDTDTGELGELTSNGESDYYLFGAYAENEFMLTNKLSINLGLRYDLIGYDWKDKFNTGEDNTSATTDISAISPKFAFAYNPNENLTIFGNIARGFRPPQISQLFVGSSYGGIANPDLKPEYLTNYELGTRGKFLQKVNYQISAFLMDFTDQISSEIIPEIDPYTPVYQNLSETRHKGIELALDYNPLTNLNLYFNYSYLDARFVDDPEYGDNLLRKTPHNMLSSGLRYNFKKKYTVFLDYKFVDKYYMDNEEAMEYEGYSLVNLKFSYKYNGFLASIAINNLFDTNYATYANASLTYDRVTHQTYWVDRYIPGWPRNLNVSLSYHF